MQETVQYNKKSGALCVEMAIYVPKGKKEGG